MRPSATLVPGTLARLKNINALDSFYWMPSVINLPGVDGVLGDAQGNLFTVQATIANDHKSPADGIRKIWTGLATNVRRARTWHFVIVGKAPASVDMLVKKFSQDLQDFTLGGPPRVGVQVWGYVGRFV